MSTQVYEDALDLDLELLESTPLAVDGPFASSYPFPFLSKTGNRQTVTTRTVVIENDVLTCTLAPDLGGRIVHLLDKRTGAVIVTPPNHKGLLEAGPRGVEAREGIRWRAITERHNDLGPVDFQLVEPNGEGDPCGVWLHELVSGSPVSVHLGLFLAPGSAEIHFEMKTFNRALSSAPISPQFLFPADLSRLVRSGRIDAWYDDRRDVGLGVLFGPAQVRGVSALDADSVRVCRFPGGAGRLGPRQLDTWTGALLPLSGLGGLDAIGERCALAHDDAGIRISYSRPPGSAKLVLQSETGATVEARLESHMGVPLRIGKPEMESKIRGFAVLNDQKEELVRWEAGVEYDDVRASEPVREDYPFETAFFQAVQDLGEVDENGLLSAAQELGLKAAALSAFGLIALRQERFEDAAALFDDSLLYNAEDHLTWWCKALSLRHAGDESPESQELVNAHYLAPLEPALRAEGFFRQPDAVDGSALIKRLAQDADALVEVACHLYEWRLYSDLARWVQAALQHRDVPMLRYLLAEAMFQSGKMPSEAANEVRLASGKPINPPYPWRPAERAVLESLGKRFPGDRRIAELLALITWGTTSFTRSTT